MTDTPTTDNVAAATAATTDPPKRRQKKPYDADLLVRLLAEGQLSQREIARQTGASAAHVSKVSRGVCRHDLYERICSAVEAAHRRVDRLVADKMAALVAAHLKVGLEGTGESARKCREFLIKNFAHRPDPAGRYADQTSPGAAMKTTTDEQTLIAVIRGGPAAPSYDEVPKHIRERLVELAPAEPLEEQMFEIATFVETDILGGMEVPELPTDRLLSMAEQQSYENKCFELYERWYNCLCGYPKLQERMGGWLMGRPGERYKMKNEPAGFRAGTGEAEDYDGDDAGGDST